MRKTIVAFAGVAVLASWGPAMADLCTDKKNGLAKLEDEAPGLHAKVAKLEADYAAASALENKALVPGLAGEITRPQDTLLDNVTDTGMRGASAIVRANRERLGKELDSAKERERHVGSQIFLLRDIIAGLGCDTPTPATDYGAIDQHTQQSQQAGPGGTPQAGSGAFGGSVQSQGPYGTPSSGFGPSGSTQPAGQQGQQPGYGPGPDESGSPRVPHDQIKVGGSIGGETGGKSAMPGEPPKPSMEKHKKKPM